MADRQIGVEISADDKASAVFKEVARSAKGFEDQADSLSGTLKSLASAAIGLFAFKEVADFLKESAQMAGTQELAETRLAASLKNTSNATKEQIKDMMEYAAQLQKVTRFGDEEIISAMGILSATGMQTEELKKMTSGLLDAVEGTAALSGGTADLKGLSMALARAFTSGVGALSRYNINLSESEKKAFELGDMEEKTRIITDNLNKTYGNMAQAMAETRTGELDQTINAWNDLKEEIGKAAFMMANPLIDAFKSTVEGFNESGNAAVWFFDIMTSVSDGVLHFGNVTLNVIEKTKQAWAKANLWAEEYLGWMFPDESRDQVREKYNQMIDESNAKLQQSSDFLSDLAAQRVNQRSELLLDKKSWEDIIDGIKGFPSAARDAGSSMEELSKKAQDSFSSIAQSIIQSFQKQTDAIDNVRQALKDLSADTTEQLKESDEAYQEQLKQMARSSQQRIEQIDKEMEDTKKSMSQGWRDRIAELEAEKDQEKSVIQRIGKEITDVEAESKKDDLSVLQETHQKELEEIKSQNLEKEKELGIQWWALEIGKQRGAEKISSPDFFAEAVRAEQQRSPWEESQIQNIFNFSFGDVVEKDKLMEDIKKAIDRAAELKSYGGI